MVKVVLSSINLPRPLPTLCLCTSFLSSPFKASSVNQYIVCVLDCMDTQFPTQTFCALIFHFTRLHEVCERCVHSTCVSQWHLVRLCSKPRSLRVFSSCA